MKSRIIPVLGVILGLAAAGWAQEEPPPEFFRTLNAEELDDLVGPLALHADALVALILPASTFPTDIVLARRYLETGGDPGAVDRQPWDESVRALAHYPDLLRWLDENLEWTVRLGEAFTAQSADVMKAIQRRRAQAYAAGTLQTTPEQQVIVEKSYITIVPAQPDVIYVPYYDPVVVYVPQRTHWYRPYFSFSIGFSTGSWLSYGCDWYSHRIWYFDRVRYPDYRVDWRYPRFPGHPAYSFHPGKYPWIPRHHAGRTVDNDYRERSVAGAGGGTRRSQPSQPPRQNVDLKPRQSFVPEVSRSPSFSQSTTSSSNRTVRESTRPPEPRVTTKSREIPLRISPQTYSRDHSGSGRSSVTETSVVRRSAPLVRSDSGSTTRSYSSGATSSSGRSVSPSAPAPAGYNKARSSSSASTSVQASRSSSGSGRSSREAHER